MNKFKATFWVIVIGFIMLVFFQNQSFFFDTTPSIRLNLLFVNYQTPEMPAAILFLVFFAAGLIITYFFSLPGRFRFKKTIKNLNATVDSQQKEISKIKEDGELLPTDSSEDKQNVSEMSPDI